MRYDVDEEDCVVKDADCPKDGTVPGARGGWAEGECICPDDKVMICTEKGACKCGVCEDPKSRKMKYPNIPDTKFLEYVTCECPETPGFDFNPETCETCPDKDWYFDYTDKKCKRECKEPMKWIEVKSSPPEGYCECPPNKPDHVGGECLNCKDEEITGYVFHQGVCDPPDDLVKECGTCDCPPGMNVQQSSKTCIKCEHPLTFDPTEDGCKGSCNDGAKWVDNRIWEGGPGCQCDPHEDKDSGEPYMKIYYKNGQCQQNCDNARPIWEDCIERDIYTDAKMIGNDGKPKMKSDCKPRCRPIKRADCKCNQCVEQDTSLGKTWETKSPARGGYSSDTCYMNAWKYKYETEMALCQYRMEKSDGTDGVIATLLKDFDGLSKTPSKFHLQCTKGAFNVQHGRCRCQLTKSSTDFTKWAEKICNAYLTTTDYTYSDFKEQINDIALLYKCGGDDDCKSASMNKNEKGWNVHLLPGSVETMVGEIPLPWQSSKLKFKRKDQAEGWKATSIKKGVKSGKRLPIVKIKDTTVTFACVSGVDW